MGWLVRDDTVLASLEIPTTRAGRRRGLLGRDGIEGAMWLEPARAVHCVGMAFDLDVAHLAPVRETDADDDWRVLSVVQMRRGRVGLPRFRARAVLEASAGAFARWDLAVGDVVTVRR